ncbi:nucleotide exchange factor GrpE [Desulfovibrio litoralis]|uniref:Protein GrpE n=1 Tax=Desulfovibrio litoralis DSM 11393 TaxID=1121455 RepID=A0A1M7T3Z6_9BACT|nr:nucleotide exchange factor GrpE [Desulfovibrio litoralis]SHN65431.1 molecular chaperone GrpE [Desulfovibrio litoralis DSM 11393]
MSKKNPYSQYSKPATNDPNLIVNDDLSGLSNLMPDHEQTPEEVLLEDSKALTDDELAILARERICASCNVNKEAEEAQLRALADLDNARKRLNKEKEEVLRFASEGVIGDLLPTLDTLDLAIEHAKGQEECKNFVVGVEMTRKMFLEVLQKRGLQEIGTFGEPFDPKIHEAVGLDQLPDLPDNAVVKVYGKGYMLHDRLLRAAKVVVNKLS